MKLSSAALCLAVTLLLNIAHADVFTYPCASYQPHIPQSLWEKAYGESNSGTDYLSVSRYRVMVQQLQPNSLPGSWGPWRDTVIGATTFVWDVDAKGCPQQYWYAWDSYIEIDWVSQPNQVYGSETGYIEGGFPCTL